MGVEAPPLAINYFIIYIYCVDKMCLYDLSEQQKQQRQQMQTLISLKSCCWSRWLLSCDACKGTSFTGLHYIQSWPIPALGVSLVIISMMQMLGFPPHQT